MVQNVGVKTKAMGKMIAWKKLPPQSVDEDMEQDLQNTIDACHLMNNTPQLKMTMNG